MALLPGGVEAKDLFWERYDVAIDLHPDGTFTVTEDQLINFTDGVFQEGFAVIPLSRVEDIENVRVFEDGQPYERGNGAPGTYSVNVSGGNVEIVWWFEPAEDEVRNFTIQYDVVGGLRVYTDPDRDQLWWRVIDSDFFGDVESSTATLRLPQPVALDDLAATSYWTGGGSEPLIEMPDDQTIVWSAGPIESGDTFEIRAEFPKITSASPPAWQAADDARRAEEERLAPYKAAANVFFIASGVLLLIGVPVGIYLLWYLRGRDIEVTMPIDVLREPPDDLPPGVVGTLIDERADDHDVIAAIVNLAEKGILQIKEEQVSVIGVSGNYSWTLKMVDKDAPLQAAERRLISAIFGTADEVNLSSIRERFSTQQSSVKEAMYDELVSRGYFPRNPERTRRYWRTFGIVFTIAAAIVGFFIAGAVSSFAPFVFLPAVAIVIFGVGLIVVSGYMPRKTQAGAEAAVKWLAFRRYLEEIEHYQDVEAAKEIFARYLPYAVAFRLEKGWVRKFERVDTPAPEWYEPFPGPRGRRRWAPRGPVVVGAPGGGGGLSDVDIPDLQDVSDSMGRSLQDMSDGLTGMLNEASKVFVPYSSKSGGGGWSGGSSWSSGPTFGGGGFSGGGHSFGGGGGGGSRGFR